jgi:hypothetical protein
MQIFMYIVILPPLLTLLVRKSGGHPQKANLIMCKGSVLILCIGSFGMFLAPTAPFFITGKIKTNHFMSSMLNYV